MQGSLKIALIGAAKTGKTEFSNKILSNDSPSSKNQGLKLEIYKTRMLVMGKQQQISLNDTKGQELLNNVHSSFLNSTNIIIIFFDVFNDQSFRDVGTKWIPYLKTNLKKFESKKIVLMANKIDQRLAMSLQSIEDLAISNSMRVYYCFDKIATNILQKVIADYYVQLKCDEIVKSKSVTLKDQSGFFSSIKNAFRNSLKEEDVQAKMQNWKLQCQKKIGLIYNQFNFKIINKQNEIQKRLEGLVFRLIGSKIIQSNEKLTIEEILDRFQFKLDCKNSHLNEQKMSITLEKDSLSKRLKDKQLLFNTLEKQYLQKHEITENKISQLNSQLDQLKSKLSGLNQNIKVKEEQILSLIKQNKSLTTECKHNRGQITRLKQKIQSLQLSEKDSDLMTGKGLLSSFYSDVSIILYDSIILREATEKNLLQLKQILQKFPKDKIIGNGQLLSCNRVYKMDPINNSSFRKYLNDLNSLMYVIKLTQNLIICIYAPDVYTMGKSGKTGFIAICNQSGVKHYVCGNGRKMWRYDLFKIIFGDYDISIQIGKNSSILVQNKADPFLELDQQELSNILQVQQNTKIQIKDLEVLQLRFQIV